MSRYVIEIDHEASVAADAAIAETAAENKKRFGQDAVLRISAPVTVRFY